MFEYQHFWRNLYEAKFAAAQVTVRSSSHVPLRRPLYAPLRSASPLYLLGRSPFAPGLLSFHGRYIWRPCLLLCIHPARAFFIHVETTCFVSELSNRFRCRFLRSCVARWCIGARLMADGNSGAIIINYNRIGVTVVVVPYRRNVWSRTESDSNNDPRIEWINHIVNRAKVLHVLVPASNTVAQVDILVYKWQLPPESAGSLFMISCCNLYLCVLYVLLDKHCNICNVLLSLLVQHCCALYLEFFLYIIINYSGRPFFCFIIIYNLLWISDNCRCTVSLYCIYIKRFNYLFSITNFILVTCCSLPKRVAANNCLSFVSFAAAQQCI